MDLMEPGPKMGKVLDDLHQRQLEGEFETIEDGLKQAQERGDLPKQTKPVTLEQRVEDATRNLGKSTQGKFMDAMDNLELKARARLRGRLGRVLGGVPVDSAVDLTIIGAVKMAKGIKKANEWRKGDGSRV